MNRKQSIYERYVKRGLDIVCSSAALIVFSPLYLTTAALVKLKLGSPVLFTQDRPGRDEEIFKLYKFRTMTDERDAEGNLLPDEDRLTPFGKFLRSTSMDELPEAINILKGDMSVIGPRPQLVKDMLFMTNEQRKRHIVRPGLSGLAQVSGRNAIDWEKKLSLDQDYIENINFAEDLRLVLETVKKVFTREGISQDEMATAEDYGDYLLRNKKITKDEYDKIISSLCDKKDNSMDSTRIEEVKTCANSKKYSVLMSLYKNENPNYLKQSIDSMLNQTVFPDEIIMVEDGELTEELYAVLDNYPELTRIKNETNLGLGQSLNIGLNMCKNELVARMDTDDCSKPERCEKLLKRFAEKPYLSIVGSHIDEFEGDISNVVSSRKVPISSEEIYEYAKRRSAFNHPAVMLSKTAVLDNNGYANLRRNQDIELFGRMLFAGYKAENIDDSLLWFRNSKDLEHRRKSWQNTISYINTIKEFWNIGYSSFFDYLIVLLAQTGIHFLPTKMQSFLYKKLLRK